VAKYEAFGNPKVNKKGLESHLRFPGQFYDKETGLLNNYFRYFVSASGRYNKRDPKGLKGGFNDYNYSFSDPINLFDNLGLAPRSECQSNPMPASCWDDFQTVEGRMAENCGAESIDDYNEGIATTECIMSCEGRLVLGESAKKVGYKVVDGTLVEGGRILEKTYPAGSILQKSGKVGKFAGKKLLPIYGTYSTYLFIEEGVQCVSLCW